MTVTAFHNGVIRVTGPTGQTGQTGPTGPTGNAAPDTDRLLVVDGVVAPWSDEVEPDEVVDLAGGFLGAAFSDGHAHPILAGREEAGPAIRQATSVEQIVTAVAQWAGEHPEAEWVLGASYDATLVPDGLFDATWLDAAVPDRPVVLRAWDYHSVWCNSAALRLAGIDASTPDPPVGRIARRPDGTPLGTLFEWGAVDLVMDRAPAHGLQSGVEALARATARLAACGIAWVQDAWVEPADVDVWVEASRTDRLAVRADLALRADPLRWVSQVPELATLRARAEAAPGLTCHTVKFFVDGIIENRTASLLEPYADACTHGLPVWSPDALCRAAVEADAAGFDLHLHAIGDAGMRAALDAVEHVAATNPPRERRATIAHAQLVDPADLGRIARLGVVVCFQPLWAQLDDVMRELTLPRLGPHRVTQYPIASVVATGARISFGSDWPVTSPDVLAGIATALTRHHPQRPAEPSWLPEERIDIETALDAATSGVAHQAGEGRLRGTLHAGRLADLVWLSADPRQTPPERLTDLSVLGTWCAGVRTHPSPTPASGDLA